MVHDAFKEDQKLEEEEQVWEEWKGAEIALGMTSSYGSWDR